MRKKVFVAAMVFMIALIAVVYFFGRNDIGIVGEYGELQPAPIPYGEEIGEPEISAAFDPSMPVIEEEYEYDESYEETYEPEPYEPYEPEVFEGDIESPWHPIHFRELRPAQPLTADTPHGYISVGHIRYMSNNFYRRFPFSYQEKRAAIWIVEELLAMGYTWDNIQVQEFSWVDVSPFVGGRTRDDFARWGFIYANYDYLRDTYLSQNIILTVPGRSQQVIVIGAHYDTLLYPGASDNASGTALLLESAQRMLHLDNYYTLVYIFFGAEEVGLLGAHYYVNSLTSAELEDIIFMLNADVLFEGTYFLYAAGYMYGDRNIGANDITRKWDEIAYGLGHSHNIILQAHPASLFLGSVHRVFKDAGVTVMFMFGTYFHDSGGLYFRVFHSDRDCYNYIMNRWPDKIREAMWTFSVFLEELLLAEY